MCRLLLLSANLSAVAGAVAGCGHVEDVILRDVARTFPEHPLFSAHLQGQQRLLRLLKAYAAADPEVCM